MLCSAQLQVPTFCRCSSPILSCIGRQLPLSTIAAHKSLKARESARAKVPVCSTLGLNVHVLLSSCSSLYLAAKSHTLHCTGTRRCARDTNRRARSRIASLLSASWNSRSSMGTVSAEAMPANSQHAIGVKGLMREENT
jgi:hypothetical protein